MYISDLNFMQLFYRMQYFKAEIKRKRALEIIASNVEEQMEPEKIAEVARQIEFP